MKKTYISYLLRLWTAQEGRSAVWRASLEDPHTGAQLVFASPERLFAFLNDQCNVQGSGEPGPVDGPYPDQPPASFDDRYRRKG